MLQITNIVYFDYLSFYPFEYGLDWDSKLTVKEDIITDEDLISYDTLLDGVAWNSKISIDEYIITSDDLKAPSHSFLNRFFSVIYDKTRFKIPLSYMDNG